MLFQPIQQPWRIVVRQPILARACFHHIALNSTIRGIVWIGIPHQLDVRSPHLVQAPIRAIAKNDRRASDRKTHGPVKHVEANETPGKFPRITAGRIVKSLRLIRELILPSDWRLMTDSADGRRVHKTLLFLDKIMIRAIADRHSLRTFRIWWERVLVEGAIEFFAGLAREFCLYANRLRIMQKSNRLARVQQCPTRRA